MLPEINETKHPLRNLILAPIWGLLFIMFLPAIGFWLVGVAVVKWAVSCLPHPLASPATGAAYLTGVDPKCPGRNEDLTQLADEVAKRRSGK